MSILKNLFLYSNSNSRSFTIGDSKRVETIDTSQKKPVDVCLDRNIEYIEKLYNMPLNSDVVFRRIQITVNNQKVRAILICVDGLSGTDTINLSVLKPLMAQKFENVSFSIDEIYTALIPQVQVSVSDDINDLAEKINIGNAIMLFDGLDKGLILDVKSWEHRGVDSPENETVIQGPKEAFNGLLRTSTALIRKTINSHNLVCENFTCGKTSRTPGSIVYMSNVVNTTLLNEVRFRLSNIDAQYVISVLDIEKYIEDSAYMPIPQMLTTERPDRVARSILNGKIAIILNGSSNVLILPATVFDLSSSTEDDYLRFPYSVLITLVRMLAVFTALLAPGMFVAIINYHRELILTPLLLAIQSSRVSVPFTVVTELLLMELAFELIKEAGVRIPGPIGSTLGIVGGLILGQSAVDAGIVSPIMIIVVAITGLASFAIPSYPFSFSLRTMRFLYIIAGAFGGFLGVFGLLFVNIIAYLKTKSFGVEVTYPMKRKGISVISSFFTLPIWKQNYRPGEAKPADKADKGFISRKWKF